MKKALLTVISVVCTLAFATVAQAQELNAKVIINTSKLNNTKLEPCEAFRDKSQEFLNSHQWTDIKYQENEKIDCTFNVTINKYNDQDGLFECSMLLNVSRPVFNSSYTTTLYSVRDASFNFRFDAADQLEWNPDNLDNQLIALLVYYAHFIIGMDLDSFSPMGGTEILKAADNIVQKAQSLGFAGWAAFSQNDNRYALLNDYIDGSMESMRELTYQYHRNGLDQMADSAEKAVNTMFECIELLDKAHQGRNMSLVPQLFCEYKKDELVNILKGKGTSDQRKRAYDVLFAINPSMAGDWDKIRK